MKKNRFISISIEDQILWRDRWILFLIFLALAFTAWTAYEINKVYEVQNENRKEQELTPVERASLTTFNNPPESATVVTNA